MNYIFQGNISNELILVTIKNFRKEITLLELLFKNQKNQSKINNNNNYIITLPELQQHSQILTLEDFLHLGENTLIATSKLF